MSRYEARRKFGEDERGVRVARVAVNSINDNKNYKKVELTNFQICQNHASQRPNYSKWSQLEIRRKLQLEYRFNVKLTFYSHHKSHQLQITFICSFQRLSTYSVWFCQGQIFKPCIRLLPQITWDDRPSWSSLFEHCLVPLQRLPRPPGPMNFGDVSETNGQAIDSLGPRDPKCISRGGTVELVMLNTHTFWKSPNNL